MKNLVTHEPVIKIFVNGFQITFPNLFTVIVKSGPGTKCTQKDDVGGLAEMMLATRFGGSAGPDSEVEIYNPLGINISETFGEQGSLSFVNPIELSNILYIVSRLRYDSRRLPSA
jgi:hypothetical protein